MEAVATPAKAGASATRVLLVAPPAQGGLASHVIALMSALHRDDYPVGVVCQPGGRIAEAASQRQLPCYEVICSARGGPLRVAWRALRLAKAIGDFKPHIVHAHSFGASTTAALASVCARSAKLLLTIHNYPPGTGTMASTQLDHRWALRLALQRAHRVITVSDALRRDLITAYPGAARKCLTIHNGVDAESPSPRAAIETRARFSLPLESPLVGLVARLAPQKGIADFLRAAAIVARAWPTAAFALAGDGPLRTQAAELCEQLGLQRKVHLLGHVEEAHDLIAALDVLVVSSLTEGSSVVAMEAMALGKPVVATSVGGVPEVVADGQTGLLVPPADPEALARAVAELLADPARAQEMGARGRQRAAALFNLADMTERVKAAYADLVREQMEAGGG